MLASSVHRGSTLNKDNPASKTHPVLTCSLSFVHRGSSLDPNQLPKDRNRLRCSTCSPCPTLHTCQKCHLLCHRTCANRPVVRPGDCTHQITLVLLQKKSFVSLVTESQVWNEILPHSSAGPSGRSDHCSCAVPGGRMLVLGGFDGSEELADLHVLSVGEDCSECQHLCDMCALVRQAVQTVGSGEGEFRPIILD
jgi:hypothetical protein